MTDLKLPLPLRAHTPDAWAEAALADPASLLSDHAHNEKKAALTALSLSGQFPDHPRAMVLLARLAEEELNHYRRVLEALHGFGWSLRPDGGNAYAQGLLLHAQEPKGSGPRLLDRLLVSALIEARSCERLFLLERASTAHPDLGGAEWMAFLFELERCEAGHALSYVRLAEDRFGTETTQARLDRWLDLEADVIRGLPWRSVVH